MPKGQLVWVTPVEGLGGGSPEHPWVPPSPGEPAHPIEPVPPLPPGIWPSPGRPVPPIALPRPPLEVTPPIVIPGTPEHPITLPPGVVWPPLNPGDGLQGKVLALVWLVGIGYKWAVLEVPEIPGFPMPPHPDQGLPPGIPPREPKR